MAVSLWRPWFPELVTWMARLGLTEPQMAAELGVAPNTFANWRCDRHPELKLALAEGRMLSDARVEGSLYARALGIHTEVTVLNKNGDPVQVSLYEKPDVVACIFWLKNRRPDLWRDTWRMEHTGKDGTAIKHEVEIDYSSLSDEELAAAVAQEAEGITRSAAAGGTKAPLSLEPPQPGVPKAE